MNWFKYSSPQTFYPLAGKLVPWFLAVAAILGAIGLYIGLFAAPTDFQQGDSYRIIFIHVPAAWMSMLIYVVMAFWAGIGLAFNTRLSSMMAHALAPSGALMTFIALVDRRALGQAYMGYVVGMGRAPDFGTDPVVPLHRLHVAGRGDRRAAQGGQGLGGPGAGRRGQRADHLFLGAMVEHAASGGLGQRHAFFEHGGDHADRACSSWFLPSGRIASARC